MTMLTNEIALAAAIVARTRNPKMSGVAYRIFNLLIHSGPTFEDIIRLNKLGVCMCPKIYDRNSTQHGKHCDGRS